jgi:hypothetical protein
MLLDPEIALRRFFEVEAEKQRGSVLRTFGVEIAIELCDFVFALLSKRSLIGGFATVRRGNFR